MSEELKKWRDEHLNIISPSFCAAKWYNASLHLGHGYTNSCHLPLPHPIDINEIDDNPSALHNTPHKKKMRQMMIDGKRPAECSYCWKIEDIGRDDISDRVYKSRIFNDISKLKNLSYNKDVIPKTLEVSFDRQCNFACSYCNAGYSTRWGADIRKNGPYQKFKTTSAGAYYSDGSWSEMYENMPSGNPFVNAFLKWWPELSVELDEIRITGGEPMQSENFWLFIETMKDYPSEKLRLAVNSNLGTVSRLLEKLIQTSHELKIKEFDLYTSNESYGKHADYIRDGLVYDVWRSNLVKFIENAKFRSLTIMMTINSLCLLSITEFLDDMVVLKKKYGVNRPNVDLNILRWPAFMSPLTLPDEIKLQLHLKLKNWYQGYKDSNLFSIFEKAQIVRLLDYIEVVERGHQTTEFNKSLQFHDFKSFYEQYDKRRGKNFKETFPELAEWYDSIEVDEKIPNVGITDGRITHYESGEYKSDV